MGNYLTLSLVSFVTGILFFPLSSHAERLLTLDETLAIALQQSYPMKSFRLQLLQAQENRLAAKYRFRTNAMLSLDTPQWAERVTSIPVPYSLPIYNSMGTMMVQGELNVNQPLPTDGTISLRSQLYQSNESTYLADEDNTIKRKDFYTSLSLNLTQPLFTYNRLKTGLKKAELYYENTSLSLRRSQLELVYNVTQNFFYLYKATRSYEISQETMGQKKEAYELAKLKFEAGLIPEVEALEMEVDLASAKSDLLSSEVSLQSQKDQFKQQIGLDISEDIGVNTDIAYSHFDVDLDTALHKGLENRLEIRENDIEIELKKINVKETDALSEISAHLNAFYDFTGISSSTLPYSTATRDLFDSSWDDLMRRPRNRGVSLSFSIPLWDWGVNHSQVEVAKADLKRSELNQEEDKKIIVNSIKDAVRNVLTAESRLTVLAKTQEVAQRTYDISLERFNNGEITSQVLALNNNRLSSAKLSFLDAYIAYKVAVADLKRQTLWDFEENKPIKIVDRK